MNYIMLKDICAINMGQSPDSNSYNDEGYGLPFFQGNADFGERYPIAKKWCSAPQKIAKPEDILISVRAPIGAVNYAKEKCCIGRGLAAITLDKSKFSKEFIFWLLKSKNQELNNKGVGSTFKSIGRKVLEETLVPGLTKEKQMRYSEILEKLYFIIQSRMLQQKELDELVKARFVEMFGNPLHPNKYLKLGKIAILERGRFSPRPRNDPKYFNGEYPFIQTGDISSSNHRLSEYKQTLNEQGIKVSKKFCVGTIVMAIVGATIGATAILEREVYAPDSVIGITPYNYNNVFLETLLQFWQPQLLANAPECARSNINLAILGEVPIIDVDVVLQNQFADFVNQVNKSKAVIEKSLKELETLQDSLMQKYFS